MTEQERQQAIYAAQLAEGNRQQDENRLHLTLERRLLDAKAELQAIETDNAKRFAALLTVYEQLAVRIESLLSRYERGGTH